MHLTVHYFRLTLLNLQDNNQSTHDFLLLAQPQAGPSGNRPPVHRGVGRAVGVLDTPRAASRARRRKSWVDCLMAYEFSNVRLK